MFAEVDTAKAWGMKPSEFWGCSEEDKAFMVAHLSASRNMTAWDIESGRK